MGIELDLNTLSDNPEDLQKVFEQLEAGGEPTAAAPTDPEKAQSKDDPANNDPQQAEQGKADNEDDAAGVATKDGKHVIPYSVLKSERDRASRAEQIARDAQERVADLEQQLQAGNQGANNGEGARTDLQPPAASDLSADDLEALKEDFPTVYKAVMASMAAAKALETKLQPVEDSVRSAAAERERSATETVQDAIDSVPKLAHIQATNAEAFEMAKQFDTMLRGHPAWGDKPLAERFIKVTEMVESAIGTIDLPGSKQASPSAKDLARAAKAKAEQDAKASRTNVPTSLSEFPAGQHAAQDEREAAEQLTHQQLAEKFASMNADQMDAYFRSL